ncbi:hydroxyethylthiazole kinase [Paenibacillus sp. GCM10027626]|uniref:hydroxyethylthiazole kinase n=1 Tax=Paenibacillus sp. GCM10027626 TaxID=3273411 RepID=UPI003638F60B
MDNNLTLNISGLLSNVRQTKPLVHHLTNYVTVNDCANVTLAIGASPIMADDIEEAAEITAISSALVLNIGTLNKRTIESMLAAGEKANEMSIPVVLDPVGAGASNFRNQTVRMMLERLQFSVIRGNMSEIRYIAGLQATTKGVDASEADLENSLQSGIDIASGLAAQYNCTVAITGETDIVSDGKTVICIENGHPMLGSITGTGCMCTSLIASFCGSTGDYRMAAVAGLLCTGIAGEHAYENAGQKGNGSYRTALIDEISKISAQTIHKGAKVYEA